MNDPVHVVVIGGGIGGLCLAQGLHKAGVSVAVYERDRTRTERLQGYRVHIDPNGSLALHDCLPADLFETFRATCGKEAKGITMVTGQLEQLSYLALPENPDPVARHRSASRITLRQVLLAGLDEVVHFDKEFVRCELLPDGRVTAHFADGTTATGDVLVAADGGGSRVRAQYLPEARRIDTGIAGIAGKVPLTDAVRDRLPRDLENGPVMVLGAGGRAMFTSKQEFGHSPVGAIGGNDEAAQLHPGYLFDNTSDYVFWGFSSRRDQYTVDSPLESLSARQQRDLVLAMAADWADELRELIGMGELDTITLLQINTSTPMQPWPTTNVTLVGDAIHSMTPFAGIGANIALRDAQLLCHKLIAAAQGDEPLLTAIRDYEAQMIDYGFKAVRESLEAAERACSPAPAQH